MREGEVKRGTASAPLCTFCARSESLGRRLQRDEVEERRDSRAERVLNGDKGAAQLDEAVEEAFCDDGRVDSETLRGEQASAKRSAQGGRGARGSRDARRSSR